MKKSYLDALSAKINSIDTDINEQKHQNRELASLDLVPFEGCKGKFVDRDNKVYPCMVKGARALTLTHQHGDDKFSRSFEILVDVLVDFSARQAGIPMSCHCIQLQRAGKGQSYVEIETEEDAPIAPQTKGKKE